MTETAAPATARRAVALTLIPALVFMLGVVGIFCVDQGRSAADTIAAMADQSQRLGDAAIAAESARRLAAAGQTAAAGKALDAAVAAIRAAVGAEDSAERRSRIDGALPLAASFRAALAEAGHGDAAGARLSDALASLGHLAGQDLLEAEAEAPAEILQTAGLFGVLALILAAAAAFTAFVALRPAPAD